MNNTRTAGVAAAAIGLGCGVAAAVTGEPVLALLSGAGALASGIWAIDLTTRLDRVRAQRHHDTPRSTTEGRRSAGGAVGGAALASGLAHEARSVGTKQTAAPPAAPVEVDQRTSDARTLQRRRSDAPVLTDSGTGVMTAAYFRPALDDRLASARRALRPVSVVLCDVISDERLVPDLDPVMGRALRHVLREADTACRLGETRFGLLLDDTPDTSAVWAVERLRRSLADAGAVGLRAGIASYPTHALDVDGVIDQSQRALDMATARGREGIQVARVE